MRQRNGVAKTAAGAARLDIGALAAAGALVLVALTTSLVPTLPVARGPWADAILNELIVWFAALYVALSVGRALLERLATWRARSAHYRPATPPEST